MLRFVALASLALLHVAAAQSSNCIQIYEHDVFQGASQDLCGSNRMLSGVGFNNKLSSALFGDNINTVIFFDENNFEGVSLVQTSGVPRMSLFGFNDITSSIYIDFDSLPSTTEPEPNCVLVFAGGDFLGRAAQFCQDIPDLSRFNWDSSISAVKLGSNVGRFTAYDLPNFAGERRTRSATIERFTAAEVDFNDRTTSISFLLNSEVPTHIAAIDGCDTALSSPEDVCLDVTADAALRCCSVGDDDFCASFCPSNGFLVDYATAVRTCEDQGYRLCFRSEIANGDCCGTGCNFDDFSTWIEEDCTNSCAVSPCLNGGVCTDIFGAGFSCECASGFEGPTCAQDVDDCSPNPCQNGGSCADTGANSFECTCATGWTGTTCTEDVDDCAPNPCANGGTCADTGTNSFECTCASGWMGATCEEDVDDCTPNPCQNGGTCADAGTNAFECTCAAGWMGVTCTEDVNDCSPNPCNNGGSCTDLGTNLFECDCAVGFTGETCAEATHNSVIDGCRNMNTEVQDECRPKDLTAGVRCCFDTAPAVTCDSFCGSWQTYDAAVATCESAGGRLCTREEMYSRMCCGTGCGFDGVQSWIQEDCINYCDPHPCENGGTCFNAVNAPTFTCRCAGNWTGTTCSEPLV